MPRQPMILISRRPRRIRGDWSDARSWFGGAPRLGGLPWPRNKDGAPLHFVAQIDLAELAAKAADTRLPEQGSLAFFIGDRRMVLFVSDPLAAPPAEPPADMRDLTTVGGAPEWPFDLHGRALFPFWPIDFTRLDIDVPDGLEEDDALDAIYAAQNAAIANHFELPQHAVWPDSIFAGPPIPDWWRCGFYVADALVAAVRNAPKILAGEKSMLAYAQGKLDEARHIGAQAIEEAQSSIAPPDAPVGALNRLFASFGKTTTPSSDPDAQRKLELARRQAAGAIKKAEGSVELYNNRIAKLHRTLPGLKEFAAEVADWTRGRDPWSVMTAEDRAQLGRYWARMTAFPEYTVHYGVTSLDHLKNKMFATLPGAEIPAFAALPADVRAVIAIRRAPHPQWWWTAIEFARGMQEALARRTPYRLNANREKLAAAGVEKAAGLAELDAKEAAFRALAAETAEWTKGREPLRPMSDEEMAELSALQARFDALREIASAYGVRHLSDFERSTLITLATADDKAYATLPEHVRHHINQRCLLAPEIPHQVFGQAVYIQGDACAQAEEGKLLLLQLGFDDMMFWPFGDNGAYTFWITPKDLTQQNWDRVSMTFECH